MEGCSEVCLHSLNCAFITGRRAPLPLGVEEEQSRETSVLLGTTITFGLVVSSQTSTSNHTQNIELERNQRDPQAELPSYIRDTENRPSWRTLTTLTFPTFSLLITASFPTAKLPLQSALSVKPPTSTHSVLFDCSLIHFYLFWVACSLNLSLLLDIITSHAVKQETLITQDRFASSKYPETFK